EPASRDRLRRGSFQQSDTGAAGAHDDRRSMSMEMPSPSTQRATLITEPFDMVVFGGRGDLAKRKLLPALYELDRDNRVPPEGRIIAGSRGAMTAGEFTKLVEDACIEFSTKGKPLNPEVWARFSKRLSYAGLDAGKPDSFGPLINAFKDRQ